jgi:hypothetical protein
MRLESKFGILALFGAALALGGCVATNDGGTTQPESDAGQTEEEKDEADAGGGGESRAQGSCDGPVACENTCRYANDGQCDDGGPDSDTNACLFGTDCADCGERDPANCVPHCETELQCGLCNGCGERCAGSNDCGDDECGTDARGCECGYCGDNEVCNDGQCQACDCGDRECGSKGLCDCGECDDGEFCTDEGQCEPEGGTELCNNDCMYSGDGTCDDGGPQCDLNWCEFGSDCADCGPRQESERPSEPTEYCGDDDGHPAR